MNGKESKSTILNKVVYAILVFVALVLSLLIYWSLSNDNVLEVKNDPFPVRTIKDQAIAKDVVILKVDLCKNVDSIGKVRTSFISNTREIFLPLTDENMKTGCMVRELPILLPTDIEKDIYKIKFKVEYQVNPIKKVVNEFESVKFEVY